MRLRPWRQAQLRKRLLTRLLTKTLLERSKKLLSAFILSGERGRNRTYNLLIKSQLLCQLSYAPD
jgi:hypothetical protein